jgi:hypothetical protein
MTLRELGGSKVVKLTGALALLAGAIFLPVLLEPAGLELFAPAGGALLAYGSIGLLGRVPEVKKIVPPILLKALPGLAAWFVRDREIAERRGVAADMEATLRFYGAEGLGKVRWGDVEAELVSDSRLAGRGRKEIVAACAQRLATVLSLPPEVLELLHHERNATVPLWQLWPPRPEVRGRVLPALALVLARSQIVQRHLGPGLELEGPELEGVLEALPSFELEAFLTDLQVDRDGWRTGQAFWAFLGRNFAGLGAPPTVREMLQGGQGGRRDGVPVLDGLARRALREWRTARAGTLDLTAAEREAVTVLAEILFFVRSGLSPLRQGLAPHCTRLAALDEGVALAWIYLVAKQEFRDELWGERERYLRLDLFLERRPEILERRPEKPDELAVLKEALEAGDWLISHQELLGRLAAREAATEEVAEEALGAAQPTVPAETAERAGTGEARDAALPVRPAAARRPEPSAADRVELLTEAQGVRAYLITLGRSAGPVPRILDELAKAKPDRYDFEQYTPFSRIGVVPQGVAFIDFCKALRADLERRLGPPSENGDRSSYEVLVHAFQPAESNPFVIGEGEKPAMQTVGEILASRRLGSAEDRT